MGNWVSLEKLRQDDDRPLAIIAVRLIGPTGEEPHRAVLDSGADISVFPTHVLRRVGVDFSSGKTVTAVTGAGSGIYRIGNPLRIGCSCQGHEIKISAVGSDNADVGVLGLHDFFRKFRITFEVEEHLQGRFKLDKR